MSGTVDKLVRHFLKRSHKTFNYQQKCLIHKITTSGTFPGIGNIGESTKTGCKSHKLMIMHSLIGAASPGTVNLLPMATRALEKLQRLIDHEMKEIGGQKVILPNLASSGLWKASGRWDVMGSELLTVKDRTNSWHCLAPTHEEAVTAMVSSSGSISYRQLPIKLYQIGRKFRDEMRPKNGLLRCREFEMKDMYSFDADENAASCTYDEICSAYDKIFKRLQLEYIKVEGDVGAMGGSKSHEFHLISDVGEDTLSICERCSLGINEEMNERKDQIQAECGKPDCLKNFVNVKGIEIGHAFILGTKYSKVFSAYFKDKNQEKRLLFMGCYGIGVTRLLAGALEVLSSETDLRWPRIIAPHQVCLIPQKVGYKSEITDNLANKLQDDLLLRNNLKDEVVLDDRTKLTIGRRVNEAKELGYPYIVALGKKAVDPESKYEFIDNYNSTTQYLSHQEVVEKLSNIETIVL